MACPDLLRCGTRTTTKFFEQICLADRARECPHYCKEHGLMKRPVEHLQAKAIAEEPEVEVKKFSFHGKIVSA